MGAIPRGDDLTHAGRIKKLEERLAELERRDTVIADATGAPRDMILLNDSTVPAVQADVGTISNVTIPAIQTDAATTKTTADNALAKATDGLPPASSPAAEVVGGIGSLFIRWTPVANANPVTYKVYVDTATGFTPGAGNLVGQTGGTSITVRTLTAGTALAYGTTYYAKIVASDADGSAAAGAEGSGSMLQVDAPDIAVGAITATKLSADAIDGKTITGTVIRSAATGEHIEINGASLAHAVAFYTGNAAELAPGTMQPNQSTQELRIDLESPTSTSGITTRVTLTSGIGTTRPRFQVSSQDIVLNGAVTVSGNTEIVGDFLVTGPGRQLRFTAGRLGIVGQEAANPVTYQNGWAAVAGTRGATFQLLPDGYVQLGGRSTGPAVGAAIFTLPSYCLPVETVAFMCYANGVAVPVTVSPAGAVVQASGTPTNLSLAGIRFPTF